MLRCFGARLGAGVHVYPSARVWAPWLLEMGDHACLGPRVDCYNVGGVRMGAFAVVSQYSYLCGAGHDYTLPSLPLLPAPIELGERVWVAADVYIAAGVTIDDGAVIGARSSVYKDVEAWVVAAGNPARVIKKREFRAEVK
ncbi:putative colanic acid biosynthesis acetyltransferase [Paludibaculum fermentans]|uniref:putative colanic acid biosynthesis acetyltransferase n=1 Tax=Paludibaculum fermentans TaxID=1473598 RepID=UPI003EBEC8D2